VVILTVVRLVIIGLPLAADLPSNVRSMVEVRRASPWRRVENFLDFLGEREPTRNESFAQRAKEIDDRIWRLIHSGHWATAAEGGDDVWSARRVAARTL
jgi:hypothetical protein